jgi:rhomboid protease GluP
MENPTPNPQNRPPAPLQPAEPRENQSTPAGNPDGRYTVRLPRRRPTVTYTILGITVLMYLLQVISQQLFGADLPMYIGVKENTLIQQGQIWRLITPVLLHGSLIHIAFNMYALFAIGPGLEQYYGHWRFLAIYLVSGFAGNVASFTFSPNPSLGASTAIFGLVVAQAVFVFRNRFLFGGRYRSILTNIGVIVLINLALGAASPGIDNWGHLGGLLGGIVYAWLAGPVYKVAGFPPELTLEDQTTHSTAWWAGIIVVVLFSIVAAAKIL